MNQQEMAETALRQYIEQYSALSENEWQDLRSRVSLVSFKRNEIIESFHAQVKQLHFVLSGIARHYFLNEDNEEITIWISEAGGLSTDYSAFTREGETMYQIQAVTDLVCFSISNKALQELYDKYKSFERLGRIINQNYLNDFIDRNNFLIRHSARERYEFLMKEKPHYFNYVALKHIATYLGISMETLSRLRSNSY